MCCNVLKCSIFRFHLLPTNTAHWCEAGLLVTMDLSLSLRWACIEQHRLTHSVKVLMFLEDGTWNHYALAGDVFVLEICTPAQKIQESQIFLLDFYHFILWRRWKSEQHEEKDCNVGGTKSGILEGKSFFWKYKVRLSSDSISQGAKLNFCQTVQIMCLQIIVNTSKFNCKNWSAYLSAKIETAEFLLLQACWIQLKIWFTPVWLWNLAASAWFQSRPISAILISDLIVACDLIYQNSMQVEINSQKK